MIKFKAKRNGEEYERLAYGEVIVPEVPNVYGDYHTRDSVREFAYGFMINGFKIDKDHDHLDRTGKVRIVETFIAREGDPDFTVGAWVVGIYVIDDDLWNDILTGEINGFSYEAWVESLKVELQVDVPFDVFGETLPAVGDGHVHSFYARLDETGRVVAGGTNEVDGHSHVLSSHTYTELDSEGGHRHRFLLTNAGEVVNE